MPLLQKVLVSGSVPSLDRTLGNLQGTGRSHYCRLFSLSLLKLLYEHSSYSPRLPVYCYFVPTHPRCPFASRPLSEDSLGPLQFLSTGSLLDPSTAPRSKRLLCIISSHLLPLDGLSSPTSSLPLSASRLNPNSRRSEPPALTGTLHTAGGHALQPGFLTGPQALPSTSEAPRSCPQLRVTTLLSRVRSATWVARPRHSR